MESTHLPTFSKSDADLPNLAPSLRHPNPVSLRRLAECDETDRHTGATGVFHREKNDGLAVVFSERTPLWKSYNSQHVGEDRLQQDGAHRHRQHQRQRYIHTHIVADDDDR